ncbi:hypothetical protein LOTGIDRAFT_153183 [Lottia gigantea]|uniref:Uncharacterized protein n=1 Tax=Lottia gigantea TaxID=225164 RepID=V4AJH9_LOTGI|nr:hypothetical protein LOTGIDRAFT_153183 [Lottia gigantea]ESO93726.1 hypothetical protein LOTGIDRAFT_153183 [Lottia gigantea]
MSIPHKPQPFITVPDNVREQLQTQQEIQKTQHDKMSKDLTPLVTSQAVLLKNYKTGLWEHATVTSKCNQPRSYIVTTPDGKSFRRNRIHLREVPEKITSQKRVRLTDINTQRSITPKTQTHQLPDLDVLPRNMEPDPPTAIRCEPKNNQRTQTDNRHVIRSGRIVKKPQKFTYCVCIIFI